jgi:hypothetical protein
MGCGGTHTCSGEATAESLRYMRQENARALDGRQDNGIAGNAEKGERALAGM